MTSSQIQQITQAEIFNPDAARHFNDLLIDSRKPGPVAHCLFIALEGKHRDGHQFIKSLYDRGVRGFIVSRSLTFDEMEEAVFFKVADTLKALQGLAAAHRGRFDFPVIGITGSNGKTIVKEWLFQLLTPYYQIVKSPKSYNSQIGVPLSVWRMQSHHNLGIFEAGISQPGEMARLQTIIHPDIGIFTNIGTAHSEGFRDIKEKVQEKLLLFTEVNTLIYCDDNPVLSEAVRGQNQLPGVHQRRLFSWSRTHDATLSIHQIDRSVAHTAITAKYENRQVRIKIPFRDEASIENAIHCWCVLLLLGRSDEEISARMDHLQTVAMRLELLQGTNQCTIINDTYNSDLTSLQIALDLLAQQQQHSRKTIILSDLLQTGKSDEAVYREVAEKVAEKNIRRVIGIGSGLSQHKSFFREYQHIQSHFFPSTAAFLESFSSFRFHDEAILIKGARKFQFEKIEKLLEYKIHRTVLEINLSAIDHNLRMYRNLLPSGVKVMCMVKAFSYGSGSYEIANVLQYAGVDYLAVAYVDEGVTLRKSGISLPIMVMSPEPGAYDRMISWNLEPEIFSQESLEDFINVAQKLQTHHYPIHIKLDTGMHRLGFMANEVEKLKSTLAENANVRVKSIFSHLAGSDSADLDGFTGQQIDLFGKIADAICSGLAEKPWRHILNSAGITRHPAAHFDMVRLGLGLYGIDGTQVIQARLQTTGTLKTTIAQIKELPAGETVGYGRLGKLPHAARIATVSIGYADGYFRDFGNGVGYMLVNRLPAPVTGSVCMDMCMLDITGIPNVQVGDEVIVFGAALPLSELAARAGTIPYEIMTAISQRVNRIYVNE